MTRQFLCSRRFVLTGRKNVFECAMEINANTGFILYHITLYSVFLFINKVLICMIIKRSKLDTLLDMTTWPWPGQCLVLFLAL